MLHLATVPTKIRDLYSEWSSSVIDLVNCVYIHCLTEPEPEIIHQG